MHLCIYIYIYILNILILIYILNLYTIKKKCIYIYIYTIFFFFFFKHPVTNSSTEIFCLCHSSKWKLLISLHHPLFSVCKCTSVYKTVIVICLIRLHCGICHHPCIITSIIKLLLSSRAFHASSLPSPLLMTPVLSDSISISACGGQLHPSADLFKRDRKGEIIYLHTLT